MGDSYRPRRASPIEYDDREDTYAPRGRRRYDRPYRGDRRRSRSPLNYDEDRNSRDEHPARRSYYEDDNYYRPITPPETGENDVSKDNEPLKFILVRNLKESVTEAVFAKGLEKLYRGDDGGDEGARIGSLKRVLLIRDRQTDRSMGYGFAEYHSIEDSKAAMSKASLKALTIGSEIVTFCYPHKGVLPHASLVGESNSKYFIYMANTDQPHTYRSRKYYASQHLVNETPLCDPSTQAQSAEDKKSKPTSKKRPAETLENNPKKKREPGQAPAQVNSQLQYWQKKTAEARSENETSSSHGATQPASGVNTITTGVDSTSQATNQQTFAHEATMICYLCASKFNSLEMLRKHPAESKVHAENLQSATKCESGYKLMEKKSVDPESTYKLPTPHPTNTAVSHQQTAEQYRNRAAERREEEAKTATTQSAGFTGFSLKGANKGQKDSSIPGASSEIDAGKPSYGKGLGMLQKAGWTEGQGLGAGTGISAPIEQGMYASGVGLGHQGSFVGDAVEEAQRKTKDDRGEFSEKTKELARQRYMQMD